MNSGRQGLVTAREQCHDGTHVVLLLVRYPLTISSDVDRPGSPVEIV